jgi:hypothetical protein
MLKAKAIVKGVVVSPAGSAEGVFAPGLDRDLFMREDSAEHFE